MPTFKALIVEDNPVILANLVATLEELTEIKVVATVNNETDAVHELTQRASELDLVIVDIFLHSGSGLGVLKSAQEMALPARRVVLTNYATDDIRLRCANLSADRVFDKSKELDSFLDYCENLTSN
jgi:DNA-binding NarL/FixJ family response regulator